MSWFVSLFHFVCQFAQPTFRHCSFIWLYPVKCRLSIYKHQAFYSMWELNNGNFTSFSQNIFCLILLSIRSIRDCESKLYEVFDLEFSFALILSGLILSGLSIPLSGRPRSTNWYASFFLMVVHVFTGHLNSLICASKGPKLLLFLGNYSS